MLRRAVLLLQPSLERVKRGDPFLMAAAIAYNVLFAIVPLALALVAALSLVGRSTDAVESIAAQITDAFSQDVADAITSAIERAAADLAGAASVVILISLLVALYSGSRAVYATMKALRLIQGEVDDRAYVHVRGLGIAFTLAGGVALLLANVIVFLGTEIVTFIETSLGITGAGTIRDYLVLPLLALWTCLLLIAIYRWGPPKPVPRPIVSGIASTVLIGLGTVVFQIVANLFGFGAVGVLGSAAVALLWVYYMAMIVITVPEAVGGIAVLIRELPR